MANDMQERRFSAWGQTLAGWFRPGEGTPVLALHGWLDNANSFCAARVAELYVTGLVLSSPLRTGKASYISSTR